MIRRSTATGRKTGWLTTGSALAAVAAGVLAAGAAQAEVPNNNLNRNAAPTLAAPNAVNGIGILVSDFGASGLGICTGTLINPRTVLFAAHCVNDEAANNYGTANGGIPMAVNFMGNSVPGLINWLNTYRTNYTDQTYNVSRILYDARSLEEPNGGFYEADIALAILDAPTRGVPTWAMLFSPLTGNENLHVTITGYGRSGTGTTGSSAGIDFRRRAGENMIGALASIDDVNLFLFGDGSQRGLGQNLYLVDFDDPARTNRFDFNIFGNDVALPGEGITAPGDSGGPLILDRAFSSPVVAGVLSLGTRYFGAQPASSYGTTAGYQPIYLFTDYIVANNPYKYVTAKAGDGDWFDATRWTQMMDPNYKVISGGQLVTGLPTTPAQGVDGRGNEFGQICFLADCESARNLADYNHAVEDGEVSAATASPTEGSDNQSGQAIVSRDTLLAGLEGPGGETADAAGGSVSNAMVSAELIAEGDEATANDAMTSADLIAETTPAALVTAPGATAAFEFIPGGPGSSSFVPNNSNGSIANNTRPVYYDVSLGATGRTTLNGTATIDRLTIGGTGAVLNIGSTGTLNSIIDTTVTAGQLNVDGRLNTFEMLLLGGLLSGRGTVDPTILTSILGSIAPAGQGTIGDLTIRGDLVLTSGSRLFIDIGGSLSDRLLLQADPAQGTTGMASIGGLLGLNIVNRPTFGTSYTVLTAPGGLTGQFNAVSDLPGVLFPTLSYTATSVQVRIDAASFSGFIDPNSPSQVAVGGLLDRARPQNYNALGAIFGEVDLLEGAQLGFALESLAPYAAMSGATLGATQTETLQSVIGSRIGSLAAAPSPSAQDAYAGNGMRQGLSILGTGIRTASLDAEMTPATMSGLLAAQDAEAERSPWASGWQHGVSGFLAAGATNGESAQLQGVLTRTEDDDQDSWYLAGGLERTVENLTVGASLAYADGEAEFASGLSRAETRQIQGSIYASMRMSNGGFVGGHLGYGRMDLETERTVVLGATTLRADGETEGDIFSGGFEIGDQIAKDGLQISPSFGVNAYKVQLDGYEETGSVAALSIDDQDYESVQGFIGVRFHGERAYGGFTVKPALSLRAVTEISGDDSTVGAAFVAAGGPSATFIGASRDRGWGEATGSILFEGERANLTLQASSMIHRQDLDYQSYSATVSMKF